MEGSILMRSIGRSTSKRGDQQTAIESKPGKKQTGETERWICNIVLKPSATKFHCLQYRFLSCLDEIFPSSI